MRRRLSTSCYGSLGSRIRRLAGVMAMPIEAMRSLIKK